MEEVESNQENVMEIAECLTCSDHHGEDMKYYCKDHNVLCCGTCIFEGHKTCKVTDFKKELPVLLRNSKPDEMIADMKKIEIHFMKCVEMNESCVDTLGTQINRLTDQIREVRKKINTFLDEIEKLVKTEGSRIYKDLAIKKRDDNQQCLMFIDAVRSSQHVLEALHKDGSDLQKFLMAEKMRSQLRSYSNLVVEKYENTETVTIMVEFSPTIQSILSVSVHELGKVESIAGANILPLKGSRRQTRNCHVDVVDVIGLKAPTDDAPWYTGVTFLPGDRLMLVGHDNNQCILLNSSYQFITSHTLTDVPWSVCVLDDQEVAVSFINQNTILILSLVDDVIRPVRMMPTKYNCNGIAAAGKGELVVNWYCGDCKSQWSLINTGGEVKYSHHYDCPFSTYNIYNCLALNNTKTRVYISADLMHSLLCFDMDGKRLFTYKSVNLTYPRGVDVDRYDIIYVIGHSSNNIHQLSPDGSVLQVITSGVPLCPYAICIHKSKDMLVVTNFSDKTKLHIYQLS